MARLLVVHPEKGPRRFLEGRAAVHHDVRSADGVSQAARVLPSFRPDVILAGASQGNGAAVDLLRQLRRCGASAPIIIVGTAKSGPALPAGLQLGAVAFMEYPMEQGTFDRGVAQALQRDQKPSITQNVPPISAEESKNNLTELTDRLNRHMVCFAGKGQVYLQSLILGAGRTSTPRVALKCPLRRQFGHHPDVYYEYIRDVCCGDPGVCPAYQEFTMRHRG